MPEPTGASPGEKKRAVRHLRAWTAAILAWALIVGGGLFVLARYENTAGAPAHAPTTWPQDTRLTRHAGQPTVVVIAHPRCACTEATFGELEEALARVPGTPRIHVLFVRPANFDAGWEQSELWRTATGLRGAVVMSDPDGEEALKFGTVTSGETLVYDAEGRLVFSGGITGARGHRGDNAGRAGFIAVLNGTTARAKPTSVFGCPLFGSGA